ncbi:AFG1-like ATPase domain-containing protein [Trichoderma breve]|uniref:AFG1-like ATPase domain-containing protein n=1 Tax=Trichoderma breve TaxID=2034170 RepID=A0A9W9B5B1_9HYPO|nr:AFG1-like ATPase domain-containing protein [Trichoderma breve]KAJ4856079.1 AFG1-like ATPase domain-containing protein [Trichoderma breve]
MRRFSTAVIITDPLVKYQSLVAAGVYSPDPAQHRLARHLHKIYVRIKDYSPQTEYRQRLDQVARLTEPKKTPQEETGEGILALRHHAIWRNPIFKHLLNTPEAIDIDSPKGLFLSGEVGTGKSMLLDLLAEGLPTQKKKRWHFNTFMLYTLSQLENHRKSHPQSSDAAAEYSLLWMAKKLIDESPILFLDEFQLPDRAASKILSNLFVTFFQLGGVLVASSNRMPEELQNATGIDYAPTSRGIMGKIFGSATQVLKARCDFWQMEGVQDWRRREEHSSPDASVNQLEDVNGVARIATPVEKADDESTTKKRPHYYYLVGEDEQTFTQKVQEAVSGSNSEPIPWEPSKLIVYGRQIVTPRYYNGFVFWNFDKLVESFGPADYLTMASTYHTFIIDRVPVLTILSKNEARRFITLLDAMYEARCKLIIRAENPPDDLFFPETSLSTSSSGKSDDNSENANTDADDATYSETVAEVYQDQISPFRPNVSYYDTRSATSKYDPDQDSDFGLQKRPVDFGNTGAFTGEDERFAYKRAASRLWELCSARWHARTGDWWQPLTIEARHWEGGEASKPYKVKPMVKQTVDSAEKMGESVEVEEVAGLSKWRIEHLKKLSGEKE